MAKWVLISFALFVFLLLSMSVRLIFRASTGPDENRAVCEIKTLFGMIQTEMRLRKLESVLAGAQHLIRGWQKREFQDLTDLGDIRLDPGIGQLLDRIQIVAGLSGKIKHSRWLYAGIRKVITAEEIRWQTTVGTDDAMDTALISGALWGAKTMILGYISSRISIMRCRIYVNPEYNEPVFRTSILLAVRLKSVFLLLGLAVIILALRGTGIQRRRTANIKSNKMV